MVGPSPNLVLVDTGKRAGVRRIRICQPADFNGHGG